MQFYGSLESLVEYMPPDVAGALAPGKEGGLEGFLVSKVGCLADILADIERQVAQRARLSESVIRGIYQHYLYVRYYLLTLDICGGSGSIGVEQRRSGLERQLDALKQEKRREQIECWRDVAKLKSEGRKWWKEYTVLGRRVELVLKGFRSKTTGNE